MSNELNKISRLIGFVIGYAIVIFALYPVIFYFLTILVNLAFNQYYKFTYLQFMSMGILFWICKKLIKGFKKQ